MVYSMVRVNLVNPKALSDQHLIAEYNEILMLAAYIRKYPETDNIPERYRLGRGHMRFFKNKVLYLKERHENIKVEMRKRGFKTSKTIDLNTFEKGNKHRWKPECRDIVQVRRRIVSRLKLKPDYYRYCGEYKPVGFFVNLLKRY